MHRFIRYHGMLRVLVAMPVLLICPLLTLAVETDGDEVGDGGHRQVRWERWAERLELTAEQQEAMAEIRQETRKQQVALRKELVQLQNDLEGEMLKDEPSPDRVSELADRMGGLKTQLQQNRLAQHLAIRKLLTPDQRDELLLMNARKGRWQRGGRGARGEWGERGDGYRRHRGRPGHRGERSERLGRYGISCYCAGWGCGGCRGGGADWVQPGHAVWQGDQDCLRQVSVLSDRVN